MICPAMEFEEAAKAAIRRERCGKSQGIRNPNIDEMEDDVLYHLGLSKENDDFRAMFGDVKFVCLGGTMERMMTFAVYVGQVLNEEPAAGTVAKNLSKSSRYSMFKCGPVLCVSHGIGSASLSVVLHELIKLMHHAQAKDPIFLRMGTSGGLGLPGGSVVISNASVDGMLRQYQELIILGRKYRRPCVLDPSIVKDLLQMADKHLNHCIAVAGKTMCTDDFYEGQGRLDGAFCHYTKEDRLSYLEYLRDHGICNIEMESLTFGAMCHNAGIKGGVVCVTILNRLDDDQVTVPKEVLMAWEKRMFSLVALYIKAKLEGDI